MNPAYRSMTGRVPSPPRRRDPIGWSGLEGRVMTVSRFRGDCGTELPGEIMAAALEDYRFEPHFHDAWSIGAIADGACAFSCLGAQWVARRGDVVVIAPRVVHTGGTAKAGL